MNKENILNILIENIKNKNLIKLIFSDIKTFEYTKIVIRLLKIKNEIKVQFEKFKDNKVFHENISIDNQEDIEKNLILYIENFKQILLQVEGKNIIFNKKIDKFSKKENINNLKIKFETHNKIKKYFLNEGEKIDFLVLLGLMTENGKILKNSYNKFRQINRYLEFIDDTIEELKDKKLINDSINILDFGCGKSYLTFALYYYLENYRPNLKFNIIGLDLKKDVIELCNNFTRKLGYKNLTFLNMDIKNFNGADVDLVFSLHACNNATDYSLLKALELNAKAILAVPCCHHEFYEKISQKKDSPFFKNLKVMGSNGIILDKFATLATDSFRSLALELCGYKVKILEFIDMEHTPKNILIKAIKTNKKISEEKYIEYENFKKFLGINPLIEELLKNNYISIK